MHKGLHYLVVLACTGFLAYQVYLNIATYLQHQTATRKSTKTLDQVAFPSVEICLNPGYGMEFLRSQGYEDMKDFVKGISNNSFIGWAGNGSGTTNDLLDRAYVWKNPNDFIKRAEVSSFRSRTRKTEKVEFLEVPAQHPFGKCFSLDPNELPTKHAIDLRVKFMFKLTKTAKVYFFVTDPHRKTWRRDLFSYSGIQIELDLNPSSLNYV